MPDDQGKQLALIEQHFKPLRPQIEEVLHGSPLNADRLVRSILWSIQDNRYLLDCPKESLLRYGMTVASLQLEPEPKMGQIFAIPFDNRRTGGKVAQTIMGYKGYNTLGHRDHIAINGNVVRQGDDFEYLEGTDGFVRHRRALGHWASRPVIAAWATATAVNFKPRLVVMDVDELNAIKDKSPGAKLAGSPWNSTHDYPRMCTKTAKRRLASTLPFGAFVMAATMEEAFEERGQHAWIEPRKGLMVEGEQRAAPDIQPEPPEAERAQLGQAPRFPIYRGNKAPFQAASIEEWRGRMETAAKAIARLDTFDAFLEKNAGVLDDLKEAFPGDVRQVNAVLAICRKTLAEQG